MDYDTAYANAKFIPGGDAYPARWAEKAAAYREKLGQRARTGLRYGPGPKHWFDLFLPDAAPKGLVVFIHGGYWLRFSPSDFSHLSAGPLARGWAVAMPAYTLAPAAHIPEITMEILRALPAMAAEVEGPIVICGHSAGGHLAARMAAASVALPDNVAGRLQRVVPISPVGDLRPLMHTAMNADLGLDAADALAESPTLMPPRRGARVHVWVGGDERPAFLDQARRLGNAWACRVTVEAGKHHFDIIEGLEDPESPLMHALLP
ncbi:alpha/beta hydrolase [Ostreiculturibacter nitratireducens]|uniref:alpha/beta hydrolase n=1 Tax=Ostreiculturibacter nitratireducens TaxID=3075226 RepID=UPI0031B5ADB5